MLLPVLLVCELSLVPRSVAWGQEWGDVSLAAGCSPRKHPMLQEAPNASSSPSQVCKNSFSTFRLLSRFSVKSEQVEFKAPKGKKKVNL